MRKLYKATAVMGTATFVAMVLGLVRAKFLAVSLGPHGVGIFSQAMTFFQSAETVCGLGIGLGVTKYAAEAFKNKDYAGLRKMLASSVFLQSAAFLILFAVIAVFLPHVTQFVFADSSYSSLLLIVTGGLIFSSVLVSLESTMLGIGRPDAFSKSRIIYNAVGVGLLIYFVTVMNLKGSFIYIPVNAAISVFIVALFLAGLLKSESKINLSGILKGIRGFGDGQYASKLVSYGTVTLVTSAVTWLSILYARSLLIHREGPAANGLYQVVFALVSYYTPFFTNGVWGYLFPKLSSIGQKRFFDFEINRALRFFILFAAPAIAILFLLGRVLVMMIFSEEFLGSLSIFPLYLLSSFFYLLSYIFASGLLAKKQLKAYMSIILTQSFLYVLVFTLLVPRFGLFAIAVSDCTMNVFACLAGLSYHLYKNGMRISANNINLFITSLVFMFILFFIPSYNHVLYIVKWALVILWALFVIGKKEKALLLSFIRRR